MRVWNCVTPKKYDNIQWIHINGFCLHIINRTDRWAFIFHISFSICKYIYINYLQSYCAAGIFFTVPRSESEHVFPGQSCAMLCFGLADLDYRDSTDFDLLAFVESGTCSSTRQRTNRNPMNQIDSHHYCREKYTLVNKCNNGISPMFKRNIGNTASIRVHFPASYIYKYV